MLVSMLRNLKAALSSFRHDSTGAIAVVFALCVPAFIGACSQLMDHEAWIDTIKVTGTDGGAHATWSRGDAVCQGSG